MIPIQHENHAWHAAPFGSAQDRLRTASRLTAAETLRFAQGDTMRNVLVDLVLFTSHCRIVFLEEVYLE
jgi:hypothetical protein